MISKRQKACFASNDKIDSLGVDPDGIKGFRAPFLSYGPGTFEALAKHNFLYDCSIESGFDWLEIRPGQSTNDGWIPAKTYSPRFAGGLKWLWWPYTLDHGVAPGATASISGALANPIWQVMVYVSHKPEEEIFDWNDIPDDFPVKATTSGFDYNTWADGMVNSREVFLNTLKLDFIRDTMGTARR
ncbi:hypothetical protein CHISP_1282 [Chitinispirillum alkaliphilum]|nr:hypothetical protein CHISP_1282 [Chitinispirillum alkaliphilum]